MCTTMWQVLTVARMQSLGVLIPRKKVSSCCGARLYGNCLIWSHRSYKDLRRTLPGCNLLRIMWEFLQLTGEVCGQGPQDLLKLNIQKPWVYDIHPFSESPLNQGANKSGLSIPTPFDSDGRGLWV